jgi:hypothetical protein
MNSRCSWINLAPLTFVFASSNAWAILDVYTVSFVWTAYVLTLLPFIAIEAFVGTRRVNLSWRKALPVVTIGNLLSTIVGIPVVSALLIFLELFIGAGLRLFDPSRQSLTLPLPAFGAGLPSRYDDWVLYGTFVTLAFLFCIASIWIETKVALRRLPGLSKEAVFAWILRANILTCAMLVACPLVLALMS